MNDQTTFVENVNGFLSYYSRMTDRCADFICALAMETSCEGSARICQAMNLQTSGDSVIRLLTKRYTLQSVTEYGTVIGLDDFAFKKRHTYGTIIVDEVTHKPIAILVKAWCINMGLSTDEETVAEYFRINLECGIAPLCGTGFIMCLDDLVKLAVK